MKISPTKHQKRYYVKYFNGFSLHGEEVLFQEYLNSNANCVAGFSYGAQKAFDYVYATQERVDKLILLSPAFFQTQKASFIRTQLRYFKTDKQMYITNFLKNVAYPSTVDLQKYLQIGTTQELEALLNYTWKSEKIETILARGTTIEVFIGAKDKIVNTNEVQNFFKHTTIYLLKDAGHLLYI